MTWGEFVDSGYLREYRSKGVPLQRLRPVIDELRKEFGTPVPAGDGESPTSMDKELVLESQERDGASGGDRHRHPVWTGDPDDSRDQPVLQEGRVRPGVSGDVLRLRPAGAASPVVIDPLVRFGRPAVLGVATERLWELHDAGEPIDQIADGYDLDTDTVRAAVAYEEQFRSLVA